VLGREESETSSEGAEGLKACGGILISICGGTKLWVVLDTTSVEVTVTTFNGVE
jgi:hypothetical protein